MTQTRYVVLHTMVGVHCQGDVVSPADLGPGVGVPELARLLELGAVREAKPEEAGLAFVEGAAAPGAVAPNPGARADAQKQRETTAAMHARAAPAVAKAREEAARIAGRFLGGSRKPTEP